MKVISKEEFDALSPFTRGFVVYIHGAREDQPNVPDEKNPFPVDSREHIDWQQGAIAAYTSTIDSEE